MVKKVDWDVLARWKGETGADERIAIKGLLLSLSKSAVVETRFGKRRSRIGIAFKPSYLLDKAREQMGGIGAMLEDGEASEAITEMLAADGGSVRGELLRRYGDVLRRDLVSKAAGEINAIIPPASMLTVEMSPSIPERAKGVFGRKRSEGEHLQGAVESSEAPVTDCSSPC